MHDSEKRAQNSIWNRMIWKKRIFNPSINVFSEQSGNLGSKEELGYIKIRRFTFRLKTSTAPKSEYKKKRLNQASSCIWEQVYTDSANIVIISSRFKYMKCIAQYYIQSLHWAFHLLPQICTASAEAHASCSLKQMQYRFAVINGPPCTYNGLVKCFNLSTKWLLAIQIIWRKYVVKSSIISS